MSTKVFIKSYGCQMNKYDSARITDMLADSLGFICTEKVQEANLIILNSCAVREKATEKIFSELGKLRILKMRNPDIIIAVGGCVTMEKKNNIFQRAPYVNIIFNAQSSHLLPKMYQQAIKNKNRIIDINLRQTERFNHFPAPKKISLVEYVAIMEGCNKFCSYCIVPHTRGAESHRPAKDVLAEIEHLVKQGAKEIHLLGQNVNAYNDKKGKITFVDLLYKISKIDEIQRIRFTTSHPTEFNNELIACFKDNLKLPSHIHLPVQSGSNRILTLMQRGYTREIYQSIIDKLRSTRQDVSISTDIIVGFPGETDDDFYYTLDLIEKINFDHSFSFIYSPRSNTKANQMDDFTTLSKKKERLAIVQKKLIKQASNHSKKMLGTIQKVLITECDIKDTTKFSGKTENNRIVTVCSPKNILGKIVEIEITDALFNSLQGQLLL